MAEFASSKDLEILRSWLRSCRSLSRFHLFLLFHPVKPAGVPAVTEFRSLQIREYQQKGIIDPFIKCNNTSRRHDHRLIAVDARILADIIDSRILCRKEESMRDHNNGNIAWLRWEIFCLSTTNGKKLLPRSSLLH